MRLDNTRELGDCCPVVSGLVGRERFDQPGRHLGSALLTARGVERRDRQPHRRDVNGPERNRGDGGAGTRPLDRGRRRLRRHSSRRRRRRHPPPQRGQHQQPAPRRPPSGTIAGPACRRTSRATGRVAPSRHPARPARDRQGRRTAGRTRRSPPRAHPGDGVCPRRSARSLARPADRGEGIPLAPPARARPPGADSASSAFSVIDSCSLIARRLSPRSASAAAPAAGGPSPGPRSSPAWRRLQRR